MSGVKNRVIADELASGAIGFLRTPRNRNRVDESVAVWAMDNGCYAGTYPGDDKYLAQLDSLAPHRERCLFVAVPDVLGDAAATLAQFPAMAKAIRERGWPVALVGQDGMESRPIPWDDVDWVFIGGSSEWKMGPGARALIHRAKTHGKKVHVGRVNSHKRYRYFAGLGCDSADGTFLGFGPEKNAPQLRRWLGLA